MIEDKIFEKKFLEDIKEQNLEPMPKWRFILKNYAVWFLVFLFFIILAVIVSLIFNMFRFEDFRIFHAARFGFFDFLFFVLPIFWLAVLVCLIVLIYFNFKHTKRGYRYPILLTVIFLMLAGGFIGGVFHAFGFSQRVDDMLGQKAPFYDHVMNPQIEFWSQPNQGRMSGIIIENKNNNLKVIDKNHKQWRVDISKAENREHELLEVNRPARFLGEQKSDSEFMAKEIIPMHAGRGFFNRINPMLPPPPVNLLNVK